MTYPAMGGDSEDDDLKPLQQPGDGLQDDDEGGKEIIPDSGVPGNSETS